MTPNAARIRIPLDELSDLGLDKRQRRRARRRRAKAMSMTLPERGLHLAVFSARRDQGTL